MLPQPVEIGSREPLTVMDIDGQRVICMLPSHLDVTTLVHWAGPFIDSVSACREVLVDLGRVEYADVFGFEKLLEGVSRCPGRVRFTQASPGIRSLFILTHMEGLLA
jgi:hypothetical protein